MNQKSRDHFLNLQSFDAYGIYTLQELNDFIFSSETSVYSYETPLLINASCLIDDPCDSYSKMGSITGHRIAYNGVGALRGQPHIHMKNPNPP